ncbi:hypothetical protein LXT21_26050 [Myxococcus sp. K38C18041901]|uniref:hypothetical protein n=1 Tax=Myxococcus guangdongensis TaxID=2906760 RepID=UPI0020A81D25|nr:hypothetical protein [Myxococcus guangdongensis]MCP3062257.1 hypothetical protein [Myxococcus guangdongensis]
MKRSGVMLALFVALSFIGCGGTELEPGSAAPSEEGATHSQLAVCTVTCPGAANASCSGMTCTGTDGQGVTCDGVFTPCATSTCDGLPQCYLYANSPCLRREIGTQIACCNSAGNPDGVICTAAQNSPTGAAWRFF